LLLHGDQIRNILGERAEIDGQLSENIVLIFVGGQSSNDFAVRGILAQLLQFRAEVTQIIHDVTPWLGALPASFRGVSTDLLDNRLTQPSASASQNCSFSSSIFARWRQNDAIARYHVALSIMRGGPL
jgi:hypothetical protein